jgi:hypothetical protein
MVHTKIDDLDDSATVGDMYCVILMVALDLLPRPHWFREGLREIGRSGM